MYLTPSPGRTVSAADMNWRDRGSCELVSAKRLSCCGTGHEFWTFGHVSEPALGGVSLRVSSGVLVCWCTGEGSAKPSKRRFPEVEICLHLQEWVDRKLPMPPENLGLANATRSSCSVRLSPNEIGGHLLTLVPVPNSHHFSAVSEVGIFVLAAVPSPKPPNLGN